MIRPNEFDDLSAEDEDEGDEACSPYQWCLHCERAYKRGEHQMIHGLRMCPYPGCDGDTVIDGWDWDKFRVSLPQYPEIPELGVKYSMYPTDYPVLTKGAEKILVFLVSEIQRGRFDLEKEKTLCNYKEVHEALGFPRLATQWEGSLSVQGLHHLDLWTRTHQLPAIAGLVVRPTKPRRPEACYFKTHKVTEAQEEWWRAQVREAIALDWLPLLSGK